MTPYSAQDIVRLWEIGCHQHLLDRALTLLSFACPEIGRSALAALTIGQRDALLFQLRDRIFGGTIDALAKCPQCRECLEFSLPAEKFGNLNDTPVIDPEFDFVVIEEGLKLTFRLPDSRDLDVVIGSGTSETARAALAKRCVIEASRDGKNVSAYDLTDEMISRLAGRMSECDPAADILLKLDCPSCQAEWQQPFDIVSFLWAEMTSHAKRLLREVHTLAQAYGWGEADILSMSAARRNNYLEMING